MHKHVLMFDDCLKLEAGGVEAIAAKFAEDLADPDKPIVALPPGVTVACVEAVTHKHKTEDKGHAKGTGK